MEINIRYKPEALPFLSVELCFEWNQESVPIFSLPKWRPGRYQFQNFPENVFRLSLYNEKDQPIPLQKVNRNSWKAIKSAKSFRLKYDYLCKDLNAGGSFIRTDFAFLNPINFVFMVEGFEASPLKAMILAPKEYHITSSKFHDSDKVNFGNLYELYDCPVLISKSAKVLNYEVEGTPFFVWMQGNAPLEKEKMIEDFKKFTKACYNVFGAFPFKSYDFLLIFPEQALYHGVEHLESTAILLSPSMYKDSSTFYEALLGISCHELFHAWNALSLKPVELTPYPLNKTAVFETGYVLEGITTYYGDYLLMTSTVISESQYINELQTCIQKHYDNFGRLHLSLANSSEDLWVDGYDRRQFHRKVSIYNEGCLFAFVLDVYIRFNTDNLSLSSLMKDFYNNSTIRKNGYQTSDFISWIYAQTEGKVKELFQTCLYEVDGLMSEVIKSLKALGLELEFKQNPDLIESQLGIKYKIVDSGLFVLSVSPESPLANELIPENYILSNHANLLEQLKKNDVITIELLDAFGKREVSIQKGESKHFPIIEINKYKETKVFESWSIGQSE